MIPEFYFRLLDYGNETLDRVWGTRWHCDTFWRMYANDRPGGYLELEGGTYPVHPHRVHFVPAWVRVKCCNPTVLRHFYVHFDTVGISSSLLRGSFPKPLCSGPSLPYDRTVPAPLCGADGVLRRDLATCCHIKSIVYREFRRVLADLPPTQVALIERLALRSHDFAAIIEHVEEHLAEPLHNDRLAELCSMSKSHFVRRFHGEVGQTPAEYVRERRVAAAAIQLVFTDDSLESVAEYCGFPSRYYFSRVFSSLTGVPPAAYRGGLTV